MKATLMVYWLVAAMLQWTSGRAATPERVAYLDGVARQALTVAYDERTPVLYKGAYARSRSALLEASVGARESGFDPRIQAGLCRPGECDHGRAACFMQVHTEVGIVLSDAGDWWFDAKDPRAFHASDITASVPACFEVADHMLWRALHSSRGRDLCLYTGERGYCPKGDVRMSAADDWFKTHPAPAADAELMPVASD